MEQFENVPPFKKHALIYNAVEDLLKNSGKPLTAREIAQSANVAKYVTRENLVHDVLTSFHRKKVIRKVPSSTKYARFAYEWKMNKATGVSVKLPTAKVKYKKRSPYVKASPVQVEKFANQELPVIKVEDKVQEVKPAVIVTATGVTVEMPNFKVTIEL